ncbi:MAG: ribosomal RNA small subunit methyltransferase A [Myxococcales bacterium]|nr:ribosomal RNA small subunit methyltransferase A [Myxococcales bacterium]MCB9750292.1 ribosomal RNA small subunit methyltransferase A [Myxococcales bacterium]
MTDRIAPPRELLRRYGLTARHSWGQNFLHEVAIHDAIVEAAELSPRTRAVEIGAGLGTLTDRLLGTGSEVWAIERDRDLCGVLRAELGARPGFRLFEADAVKFDYSSARDEARPRPPIIGNLPYQLTGPLLFALLAHHDAVGPWIIMVQEEVAQRLCAEPGSRRYGGVTASLSRVRSIATVCRAPRGCFLPAPRVDSAVIRLDPLTRPRGEVGDDLGYQALVRTAFQRRRKVLSNALSALAPRDEVLAWCHAAGVDPRTRPERLGPEEFAALQRAREATEAARA